MTNVMVDHGRIFLQSMSVLMSWAEVVVLHLCRRVWAPVHHNIGRLALFLGFANAIIGAYAAHMGADWYIWICVVWGVIMLVGIPLIIYARMNPRGEAGASEKAPTGAATTTGPHRDVANDTPYA